MPPAGALLSWNTARLVALVLNALSGLLTYYEAEERNECEADTVLAMRIIQGFMIELETKLASMNYHPDVWIATRNISNRVDRLAFAAVDGWSDKEKELKRLLSRPFLVEIGRHKKLNESYRWPLKDIFPRGRNQPEPNVEKWLRPLDYNQLSPFQQCTSQVANGECEKLDCLPLLLDSKGSIAYIPTRQLLFLHLAKFLGKCGSVIDDYFTQKKTTSDEYFGERCINIYDEALTFRRERKHLTRLSPHSLQLLMEQVFVCGSYGYVEFANPHMLVTALSWQHPHLGCVTRERPEPVQSRSLFEHNQNSITGEGQNDEANACMLEVSTMMGLSLAAFLRFLLDPGPWSEHHYPDQLIHTDYTIVAEEKFSHYNYIKWVRDANVPHMVLEGELSGARILPARPPPPSTWSPDLIAFVLLLLVFVAGSVVAHHLFSSSTSYNNGRMGKAKRLYPYAFKKL